MRCSVRDQQATAMDRIRSLQIRHAVDRPTPVEFPRTTTNFYCFTN